VFKYIGFPWRYYGILLRDFWDVLYIILFLCFFHSVCYKLLQFFIFLDLYGILLFLQVSPYCIEKQFQQLMKGEKTIMYEYFSKLIWRSSIENVHSELNLPKLTKEQHWLTFSQIEKYFYFNQHDLCASMFSDIATR